MNSMTGYGKGVAEDNGRKITVEIKSVNHRFLDLNIKLPKGLNFAEEVLRNTVKSRINRGHLDIYVTYDRESSEKLALDENLAKEYCMLAAKSRMRYNLNDDFGVSGLFRMPDVIRVEEEDDDENAAVTLLGNALSAALDGLCAMRSKEGALLSKDIAEKVSKISANVDKIESLAPATLEEHREKMTERIREALGDVAYDEARLMNEMAFYADKIAIDEEIARLRTHVMHFSDVARSDEPVGKKLDFIVQEMNRETNTIGSKCSDASVAALVIDNKCEIEKIREQIQNIE